MLAEDGGRVAAITTVLRIQNIALKPARLW